MEHKTSLGRYDLKIKNATYDRDNGKFECAMKEAGTGSSLHQSVANLVVLLPPSQPTIEPTTPTATEGRAFNLTCSSLGGSPPPHIYWYKNGESQKLKSLYLKGATKDEATKSVLTIIPKKEDDGSTYRCTVWNRAIPENGLMEASTSINVNCKYTAFNQPTIKTNMIHIKQTLHTNCLLENYHFLTSSLNLATDQPNAKHVRLASHLLNSRLWYHILIALL